MKIFINNDKAFVFNANDASVLREDHRISGSLIGCFARKPRQNAHLGIPLLLMPEEATLLKEKGLVDFIGQKSDVKMSTEAEILKYQKHLEEVYSEQAVLCREERLADIRNRKDSILAGKRAKRKRKIEEKQMKGESTDDTEEDFNIDDIVLDPLSQSSTLIQIPTASWRQIEEEPVNWTFPKTQEEKLRYKVFKKLWEDGYFLTSGGKFGGDFLVYPGDPARYHSYYIVICILPHEEISALHLANMGRLAATVKKTVLLCSLDTQEQVTFNSLNWSHIS